MNKYVFLAIVFYVFNLGFFPVINFILKLMFGESEKKITYTSNIVNILGHFLILKYLFKSKKKNNMKYIIAIIVSLIYKIIEKIMIHIAKGGRIKLLNPLVILVILLILLYPVVLSSTLFILGQ